MKNYFSPFVVTFMFSSVIYAQNPVTPPGIYLSDPSAREWKDGKLYVYGSRDEARGHFCSKGYDVLSTGDLQDWKVTTNTFSTTDAVRLWAPDCMEKNGRYYLYYCLSDKTEGAAESQNPDGPFANGRAINLYGNEQIDPCVFKDDDGEYYYIWGQFSAYVAKFKPDMTAIDPGTIHKDVVTEKDHHFHEGASMVKRGGIYYMVYTDVSRAGMPTCLGYATAKSAYGPFTYRGVIIDNSHCDPGNWNNHGCLVKFKNKWYVFYHRSSQNSHSMRRACVEPITFRKDGSIPEVEMTTQGALPPLAATDTLLAGRACLLFGGVYADGYDLSGIQNNDKAVYKYLDFEQGADSVTISVAPGQYAGRINVITDQLWHGPVAIVKVPGNDDGHTWQTFTVPLISQVKGKHELVLQFNGRGTDCFRVSSIRFKAAKSKG